MEFQSQQVPGVPVVPSSVLGMGTFIPSGPVIAPHPYVVHPQGAPQSVASASSHLSQNQMGYFQPVPGLSHQHWHSQQVSIGIYFIRTFIDSSSPFVAFF